MNKSQIEYLSKKIVQMTNHIEKQLEDRSALLKSYNTEIKESKKRIKVYAKAVGAESIATLDEIMGEFELAELEKIGREHG
jgi:ribosomal protein S15P/S13E